MAKENPLKIVDVSTKDQATAELMLELVTTQGFLFVDGHPFSQEEVDLLFNLSKTFFQLPMSEKLKHKIDADDCGYTNFGQELLDPKMNSKAGDPKEAFNFGRFNFLTGECHNDSLPELFVENQELLQSITKKFYQLSMRILELLAMGLQVDDTKGGDQWFSNRHKPTAKQITAMRFLHYPLLSKMAPEETIRAGAHTDYGTVTLLFQQKGQEGLELFDEKQKIWKLVPYIDSPTPGNAAPIIVNIADQLSFWTGGFLKSTKHRVKMPQDLNDRYSIVFFLNADNDVLLEPIPSPLVLNKEGILNKEGKIMTSREHLTNRFQETYIEGH